MTKLLLVAAIVAASLLVAAPASAQTCPRRDDALVLAILSVHEAGWEAEADMRGIHAALRAIAARLEVSYATAACVHSGRALRGETDRPWVSELDERARTPRTWPTSATRCREGECVVGRHPPFGAYRARWLATLELARRVVLEEPAAPCLPATWGSREDVRAGEANGRTWVDVACGETRNRFGSWSGSSAS